MQRGPHLSFQCTQCSEPIFFSVLELEALIHALQCPSCNKKYAFSTEIFNQLRKFEALCRQIRDSEEILGATHVAIDVGSHHVKVPYRLLLTRLSSIMNLTLGDKKIEIFFRTEPLNDCNLKK